MRIMAALGMSSQTQGVDAFVETLKGATFDDHTRPDDFITKTEQFKHDYRAATQFQPPAFRTFQEWMFVLADWATFDELFADLGVPASARTAVWDKQAVDQAFDGGPSPAQMIADRLNRFLNA